MITKGQTVYFLSDMHLRCDGEKHLPDIMPGTVTDVFEIYGEPYVDVEFEGYSRTVIRHETGTETVKKPIRGKFVCPAASVFTSINDALHAKLHPTN